MSTADKLQILATVNLLSKAREMLEKVGVVSVSPFINRKGLIERVSDVDAIIGGGRFDETFFRAASILKVISIVGTGYDNVNLDAATKHRVIVTNTPGVMAEAVAEHTLLLMLATAKNLPVADKEVREGKWEWEKYRGIELWNKTLGQIGLGRIGSLVARKTRQAFNMRVLVYDPYVDEERVLELGAKSVDLETLLKQSDIVSINAPSNEGTYHLIGDKELHIMKHSATIINTGRGSIIDEGALVRALQSGGIAKAGLDVFEEEPPKKDNPLFRMDNVTLSPHQGSNTESGVEGMFMAAARNLVDALKGGRPKYVLNEDVLNQRG